MRVALLGTGVMGVGMAQSLLRAGHQVTVWNRSREKAEPLAADGATVVDQAVDAVAGVEVVITMLYDTDSVMSVMAEVLPVMARPSTGSGGVVGSGSAVGSGSVVGSGGMVGSGSVWVQTSTIGVEGTERAAALAAEHGIAFLDAPVLGTKQPAADGQLVVLAAGGSSLQQRVEPVLDAIGARTLWVSEQPGDGSKLKLAANAWVASVTAATAQSIALTRNLGLDPALFLAAIKGGPLDLPYAQLKGGAMIAGEFPASFALDGVTKDLGLITEAAAASDTSTELLAALTGRFAAASAQGFGEADMAAEVAAFSPGAY